MWQGEAAGDYTHDMALVLSLPITAAITVGMCNPRPRRAQRCSVTLFQFCTLALWSGVCICK